uniref:proline-rich proteoglycan 2-like n=1 Tax=Nyctereutes procyonoides TaxID=34880 RepID=UPI002444A45F|nr:proline-rich proteoglycan 2-like [Nyctereutes procyonoides]
MTSSSVAVACHRCPALCASLASAARPGSPAAPAGPSRWPAPSPSRAPLEPRSAAGGSGGRRGPRVRPAVPGGPPLPRWPSRRRARLPDPGTESESGEGAPEEAELAGGPDRPPPGTAPEARSARGSSATAGLPPRAPGLCVSAPRGRRPREPGRWPGRDRGRSAMGRLGLRKARNPDHGAKRSSLGVGGARLRAEGGLQNVKTG